MKQFLKYHLFDLVLFLILFYALGYFIFSYIVNLNTNKYIAHYTSDVIDNMDVDYDFFEQALRKYKKDDDGNYVLDENGEKIKEYSYASFFEQVETMLKKGDIETKDGQIMIKAKYFINSSASTTSEESFKRFKNVMNKVIKYYDAEAINTVGYENIGFYYSALLALIFLGVGILFDIGYLIFGLKHFKYEKDEELYVHPFSLKYWKDSALKFKNLKTNDITLMGVLLALVVVCKFIPIPSGFGNLGLGLTYLVLATMCLLFGPLWGLLFGAFSDILGFIISPTIFLFEYTIQAAITCFIYGIFFYKKKFSFISCLTARVIINFLINALWGSYLFIYRFQGNKSADALRDYITYISLPKNIVYLIPQTLLLFIVVKAILPLFKRQHIIPQGM